MLSKEMQELAQGVLAQAVEQKLETVRVLFVDQHGVLRGKTIVASALEAVLRNGIRVPSTLLLKDTSHKTAFQVWGGETVGVPASMQGASDVLLLPRPETFKVLPWSPHSAWIFCQPVLEDGSEIPFCSLRVLRQAETFLAQQGASATFGLEVEFQIFERAELGTASPPGGAVQNLTAGYQYLTEARYGEIEATLDLLRRNAEGLGLAVRSVEIEMGPSQVEFTFAPSAPLAQADAMTMFRTMVREVCHRNGLLASFMPKPRLDGAMANGWHIHQSLQDSASGQNLFLPEVADELTPQASGWIAGLLQHARESSLLIAPTVNSYKRYLPFQLAPSRIQWGRDNRGAMLRGLMAPGDAASRIENRAPDSAANPYFALAAQMIAGGAGLANGLTAPAPTDTPYDEAAARLPRSLGQALEAFSGSQLYRDVLGIEFTEYLLHLKKFEWERYLDTVSEWEQAEYFNLF